MDHLVKYVGDPLQLSVSGVIVPVDGGDGVLRLEQVSHWGVVYDDDILHGAAQSRQVFDEGIVEESAVLSEQEVGTHLTRV